MAIFGQCLATFLFHHLVTLSVTQSKGDRIDSQIIFSNKKLIQQIILALPLCCSCLYSPKVSTNCCSDDCSFKWPFQVSFSLFCRFQRTSVQKIVMKRVNDWTGNIAPMMLLQAAPCFELSSILKHYKEQKTCPLFFVKHLIWNTNVITQCRWIYLSHW